MRARHAFLPAFAVAAALTAGPVAAQTPPTPEQALALEGQITAWLKTMTGSSEPSTTRPVQLTAEGDHYLVRIPIGKPGNVQPPDAAFTAKARMLDATRWAVDDEHFPDDLTITSTENVPSPPDSKSATPDATHPEPVTYHVTVSQQAIHGVFDPSNTQPATNGGTVGAIEITKTGGASPSQSQMQQVAIQASTRPIDANHLDVVEDVTTGPYTTRTELPDGSPVSLAAQRLHIAAALSGLAHDRVAPMVRALATLGKLARQQSDDASSGMTPAQRAQLRVLLLAAESALTGGRLEESAEQVVFDFGGTAGTVAKAAISFGGDAPQTTLSAQMGLTLDGLTLDALPPTMAAYIPTHFAIRPSVSNLDVAALTRMAMAATAPDPDAGAPAAAPPEMQSLFAKGGINVGFDALELTVVGAQLTGTGKFNVAGPNAITGQADLSATGLDALIAKMQADPMLAQGVPVVIFLKGIARTSGAQTVWQVTVNNASVLVNGVDLSAMADAMGK